jgi:hypothetical protein
VTPTDTPTGHAWSCACASPGFAHLTPLPERPLMPKPVPARPLGPVPAGADDTMTRDLAGAALALVPVAPVRTIRNNRKAKG